MSGDLESSFLGAGIDTDDFVSSFLESGAGAAGAAGLQERNPKKRMTATRMPPTIQPQGVDLSSEFFSTFVVISSPPFAHLRKKFESSEPGPI
jgi:hypothetical protein